MTLKEIKNKIIEVLTDKSGARIYWKFPEIDWSELCRRIIEILTDKRGEFGIPKDKVEAIAETILPDIVAFFQTEEGKRVFAEWKKEQEERQKAKGGET